MRKRESSGLPAGGLLAIVNRLPNLAPPSFHYSLLVFHSMGKSVLREKSYAFAVRIMNFCRMLQDTKKEYIVSKQLLRSGTGIGALLREAEFAQSRPDFVHKVSIALKEANETIYWLQLLTDTNYIPGVETTDLQLECNELIAMLAATVKTAKKAV